MGSGKKKGHAERTQQFYALEKGELVQKLLRRWWYAITWPDPACAGNVSACVQSSWLADLPACLPPSLAPQQHDTIPLLSLIHI